MNKRKANIGDYVRVKIYTKGIGIVSRIEVNCFNYNLIYHIKKLKEDSMISHEYKCYASQFDVITEDEAMVELI